MSVEEILKIVLALTPKTVEEAEALLIRTEIDTMKEMVQGAPGACVTRHIADGPFEKFDIIAGFIAVTDMSFDIEFTDNYTRHYELARGEFMPAFEGQPISLLAMMTRRPCVKNVKGMGYVALFNIDDPYRKMIDKYVINDKFRLAMGFLIVKGDTYIPGANDIMMSIVNATNNLESALKQKHRAEIATVEAAIGKWGY